MGRAATCTNPVSPRPPCLYFRKKIPRLGLLPVGVMYGLCLICVKLLGDFGHLLKYVLFMGGYRSTIPT